VSSWSFQKHQITSKKSMFSARIFIFSKIGNRKSYIFAPGELAERSIAAVLKTVEGNTSWGSNP
jgi:hypothetical protein